MSFHAKMYVAIAIACLALAGVGFASWLGEHDARLKLDAELKADKAAMQKIDAERKAEREAEARRDEATAKQNAATLAEVAKVRTAPQMAAYANKELPGLPAPAIVTVPPKSDKPDAPAPRPLTTVDSEVLDDRLAECRVAENNFANCKADLAGRERDRVAADAKIELLKKENADYARNQGKTKWARAWNNVLKPALFAGAGYALGRISK